MCYYIVLIELSSLAIREEGFLHESPTWAQQLNGNSVSVSGAVSKYFYILKYEYKKKKSCFIEGGCGSEDRWFDPPAPPAHVDMSLGKTLHPKRLPELFYGVWILVTADAQVEM